ncbi:MAG: hypothetical protein ACE5KE_03375 [Methanosarcinales archaeon]
MGMNDVNVILKLEKSKYGFGIRCFQCGSFNILDVLLQKIAIEQRRLIAENIVKEVGTDATDDGIIFGFEECREKILKELIGKKVK